MRETEGVFLEEETLSLFFTSLLRICGSQQSQRPAAPFPGLAKPRISPDQAGGLSLLLKDLQVTDFLASLPLEFY